MPTLQTGNISPLVELLLRAGYGTGKQQGYENLLAMRRERTAEALQKAQAKHQAWQRDWGAAEMIAGIVDQVITGGILDKIFPGQGAAAKAGAKKQNQWGWDDLVGALAGPITGIGGAIGGALGTVGKAVGDLLGGIF